jgi:hypothetical protein
LKQPHQHACTHLTTHAPPKCLPQLWSRLLLLTAPTTQIRVVNAPSVRDAFAAEVVKLSPQLLKSIDFRGCHNLHKLVLSPQSSCPVLEALNLSSCPGLEYVLLQSNSLKQLDLSNCGALTKVAAGERPEYCNRWWRAKE